MIHIIEKAFIILASAVVATSIERINRTTVTLIGGIGIVVAVKQRAAGDAGRRAAETRRAMLSASHDMALQ
ncbi:MAG: hypothetical protein ACJ8AW_45880 [Rhodopila sp.]